MSMQTINNGVFCINVNHPDREMFDCLMPTPHGTTYNAYIVRGAEKTALIDTSDSEFTASFLETLSGSDFGAPDYVVILHTEQDHSGSLPDLLKLYPDVRLVATDEVVKLVQTHLGIPGERFERMSEGDALDLGGRSLRFMKIPFAHWPDNTMVFDDQSAVLFSSDLFGSHYSSDRIFATNSHEIKGAARAYFAEIMMPFSTKVRDYTEKVKALNPSMIASAHGPVWNNPGLILEKYMKWTSDKVDKTVVIPYVSMHGSCGIIAERLCLRLARHGISVLTRDLGKSPESLAIETGNVMYDLVTAAALVFVTPTVLGGPHPAVAYCAMLVNALRPRTPIIGLLGSYGWATKVTEVMDNLTSNLRKAERIEPVLFEGLPDSGQLEKIDQYADVLAEKIRLLGDRLLS
ncbi:MAG: FprA family A-type flavoprotein [Clostridiaceae bacterium]|nr:FprA family A-type flavoprotein [Clostridiaceae bacterium]